MHPLIHVFGRQKTKSEPPTRVGFETLPRPSSIPEPHAGWKRSGGEGQIRFQKILRKDKERQRRLDRYSRSYSIPTAIASNLASSVIPFAAIAAFAAANMSDEQRNQVAESFKTHIIEPLMK